jgi:hypothetical protein
MEGIVETLNTPAGISALGAVLSALFAGLAFVFSRRLSQEKGWTYYSKVNK